FISHASEDYEIAKRLYDDLKREGITPWIDGENLLVGQNWRETIPHIIRKSSHFLLVISKNSVSKTGYIQEEQRIALDFLNKFPPGKIFIIPARLDNTEPAHEKLRNLHWADLSDYDKGLAQILKALKSDNSGD
ncbi:MAG: serine/threonine-protein kinase pkn1, partial [Thermoplasmata archaeon]